MTVSMETVRIGEITTKERSDLSQDHLAIQ